MEVAASVASIAGILGFAGQAISGITKLHEFFRHCRNASQTVDRFLRDLGLLKDTISHVSSVMSELEGRCGPGVQGTLASLQIQLEDCRNDIDVWTSQARKSRPTFGRGAKSAFKKFMIAVNNQSMKDGFMEISSHRESLALKLSIIGRHQEIYLSLQSQEVKTKLDEVSTCSTVNNNLTMETLQRLENLVTHVSTQQQSSFGSLESRASRIKSLISVESGFHGAGSRRCSISREENDTDENISDFLKLLERKKALQSIKGSIEASGRPISDQLSKFQAMRESNDSLPVSMSSSLTDLNSVYNEPNNKTDEINSLSDRTSTGCSWVSPKGLEGCDNIFQELGSLFATRLQHQRSPERSEHAMPYIRTPERSDEGSHIHTMPYICTCCPKNMQAFTSEKDLNEHQQRNMKCRLDYLDSHGDFIFMDPEDPHLVSIRQKMKLLTERLETKRIPLRQAAWEAGCSFDNVDTIWYEEDGFRNKQESTEYYPTLLREDRNLTLEATAWCTQTDRINFWMLQCLASSQEQEALHRAFLSKASEPEALSEKEWARLVLKFWPLDEAAKWAGDRTSSTNGAVDSNGAFHSARVSFKSGGISKQKIASDAIDAEVEEKLRRK